MDKNHETALRAFRDPDTFALRASGRLLRSYQRQVMDAIVQSIRQKAGRSFVIIFARQAGKNELQAQLFTYLLAVLSPCPVNLVSVSPTFKPQSLLAMRRLETVLSRNIFTRLLWKRHDGNRYTVGKAGIIFLSADPSANVVGETAHVLLSVDEAQDVDPRCFAKIFTPMAAAHNATRLFWGTSWTADTLLARERRLAEQAQSEDGIRRLWVVPADLVAAEVPSYARFLQSELARMGRDHPIIRSQYFCQEIDAELSMFTPSRLALIQSDHNPGVGASRGGIQLPSDASAPWGAEGGPVAFLLDVAGQDESRMSPLTSDLPLHSPGRDSTTLSIVSIDLSTLDTLQAPTYRVIHRQHWLGQDHVTIFGALKALADRWHPLHIVIDATGVGEGLYAMLNRALPSRVIPIRFNRQEKSEIGWRFLAAIETGRFRDTSSSDGRMSDEVYQQYLACRSEILPGPAHTLRWGVPEGARAPDGTLLHDDFVLADSLVAALDRLTWSLPLRGAFIQPSRIDPLRELGKRFG